MPNITTAAVFLEDRRIGTLGYRDGSTWFDYEDRDPQHPVLGQRFELVPDRRRSASGRLPAWFANLLPEPGSGLRHIVARELGKENPHDYQVITYLGEDLPGAVRVVPDSSSAEIPELLERVPRDVDQKVRFSLAGVQPKFSMRWEGKGLILPMSGQGGNWIVKLPDRRYPDLPANEYSMLRWAHLAGINVPRTELFQGEKLSNLPHGLIAAEEYAFGVERFDRIEGMRVHQEDFAQVTEVFPERKYERATYSGIARFINENCPQDLEEYVRRLAACIVMGNTDAHLKNWTIRYPDRRTAQLSPAYDFVSVSSYPEFLTDKLAFPVNGGQAPESITLYNFQIFAERANINSKQVLGVVTDTVTALVDTWPQVKHDCPVPGFVVNHIEDRLSKLPLAQSS